MIPLEGIQPNDKPKPCRRTNKNHGPWGQTVEAKLNSYRESSLEFSKMSRVYLGTRRPNATQIPTSFHRTYFRDQHQLNSGTEFLFGWSSITIHNFRSFSQVSTIYYSQISIHHLLFIISQFIVSRKLGFRVFIFHNQEGLTMWSWDIIHNTFHRLGLVYISSLHHVHSIPLLSYILF